MVTMERTAIPPLGIDDRCDRCGARAYLAVRMRQDSGVLMFCGHHASDHILALMDAEPFDLRDDTHLIGAGQEPATETAK